MALAIKPIPKSWPGRSFSLDLGTMMVNKPHKPDIYLAVEIWENKFGNKSDTPPAAPRNFPDDWYRVPLLIGSLRRSSARRNLLR